MMTRVQWILVASALVFAQAVMQGCSSCGDNDKVPKDAGSDGGGMPGGGDSGEDGGGGPGGGAGAEVNPPSGLRTTEGGGQSTFTVVLTEKPSANVVIALSSSDETEGKVGTAQLVFTPENWNARQTVTVTGVDDDEQDGPQEYEIRTAPAQSDDDNYDGLDIADVSVTNTDDETAGISVAPTEGLETSEEGDTAKFAVVLDSKPSADVTIGLTSDNTAEGSVSPESLTFTAENWNAPQEVTVTGEDDSAADGPKAYKIVTAAASSSDESYDGIDAADVSVTNIDDDTPGFRITPSSGLVTTEEGEQATFTVRLNTQPTGTVTVALSSEDGDEISFAPATLTFTTDNWNGLHEVIVTGLPDDDADGEQPWEIVTAPAVSDDDRYAGFNPPNVSGRNIDADSAGVSVNLPEEELRTRESGGSAQFSINLRSRPTSPVTIRLATEDADEVQITPTTLVFTADDWDSIKTVDLAGVDDPDADGDQPFTITLTVESEDDAYDVIDLANIVGRNIDDETAGISVDGIVGLEVRESGTQDSFTVRLNSRPTANVTIGLRSSDPDEVTVSVTELLFTPENWAAEQTITLTGQNDSIPDEDQEVDILFDAAESDDLAYNGRQLDPVRVVNVDDDTPDVRVVVPPGGLNTSENGGQASFTVALATQPSANVTIMLTSSDTGEAILGQGLLTFTPDNWAAPQTVTLTGQNDDVEDGLQPFDVLFGPVTSDDEDYDDMEVLKVSGTNTDNDTAGITLGGTLNLTTSEVAHGPVGFTVVLNSQPVADVTIPILSLNEAEGIAAPTSLVFTTLNWAAPQTVNLTGQDDLVADGPQVYFIRIGPASGDPRYAAVSVPNVEVRNLDDDTPGILVNPLDRLEVAENGDQDTFTVRLNSRPTAAVTIPIASSDTGEATVSPGSLTFTTDNWAAPQTVIVTGRSDLAQDGHQDFAVHIGAAVSTDGNYGGRTVPDLLGTNLDIDSPAIRVIAATLRTDERGGQDSFQVVLLDEPDADVTIPIVSSDTTEGTVSTASLVFTQANWASPQVVTLTGEDDDVDDGNQPYYILVGPAMSTDPEYGGRTVPNLLVTNTDDDTAGVTLDDTDALTTTEAGGTDTFTIVLNSEPTHDVTFHLDTSDHGEATVAPATITFTALNWNAPRVVTLTGQNDDIDDGAQPVFVTIGSPDSDDPNYAAQFVPNVAASNTDDDTAGVTVVSGVLVTSEGGGTASFTVRLNSEPIAAVVIPITSGTPTEGLVTTPAGGSLTFDNTNWAVPQTVTITGQNDFVQDGDQTYAIHLGPIQGGDATYTAIPIPDLSASNTDNDTAGITVSPLGPISTTEAGVATTFTVVLDSQPTGPVALALESSDVTEARVSPAALNFTAGNWNVPQTVTVTGQNDFVADSDQPYAIHIGPAVSTDGNYDTMSVPDVLGTNQDDDTPGFVLSATSITTYEFNVSTTFTVRLTSQPTADLTISVGTNVPGEALVTSAGQLTFTEGNWNVDQTITVQGQDDAVLDGNQPFIVELGAAVSTDLVYDGLNPTDVTGINVEAALSCNEWHTRHPALPSGIFPLDTDRAGTASARFTTYCDMDTDGGGFTLLSWAGDTSDDTVAVGLPYPGREYCNTLDCPRGSGVPIESLDALFDNSSEFAQAQSTTIGNLVPEFDLIGNYEYAGIYAYGTLAALTVETGAFTGCSGVVTGVYQDLVNTASSDGVAVFLNSGLHRDGDASVGDFRSESNAYTWSVGARGDYCQLNSASPSSYVGTWDDGQYGPGQVSAAGSYSVWVR